MNLREEARLLSMVDILESLPEEELLDLADSCPDMYLRRGVEFYSAEEHDGGLFLIKKGHVRVYRLNTDGKQLTLVVLPAGTALTSWRLRGRHAKAIEPSVVAFMARQTLEGLIQRNPEVGLRLMDTLSERLRLMDERLAGVVHKAVTARLAGVVLELFEEEGAVGKEGYVIPTHYTHEQLGAMIGAQRVAVTKAFSELREAGAVELKRRRIHPSDVDLLKRIANEVA